MREVFRRSFIIEVFGEFPIQHGLGLFKVTVLNGKARVKNIFVASCVDGAEKFFVYHAVGVHGGDIQQSHIRVNAGFCVDVSALADFFTAIGGFAVFVLIAGKYGEQFDRAFVVWNGNTLETRKLGVNRITVDFAVASVWNFLSHIPIVELALRMSLPAEYNPGSEAVRGVVDCHARDIRQNLTRREVSLPPFRVKHGLGRQYVVLAILRDLRPEFLRYGLVPRKPQFLMVNAEFNLELLQRLLLARKVVNIRVGEIVRLAEESLPLRHDFLRKTVKLFVRVAHVGRVENMIVVLAAVNAHKTELHQILDFSRRRVYHSYNRNALSRRLPAGDKEVGKDFHVVEYHPVVIRVGIRHAFSGLELHPAHGFEAL